MVLGFPKSLNIGLAIDKKNGVESKIVGQNLDILTKQKKDLENGHRKILDSLDLGANERNNGFKNISADVKEPITDDGIKWKGWGTQLKPSFEPIIIARKPFKGNLVDNVIEYGVGGINIDECRIPLDSNYEYKETNRKSRQDNNVFDNNNSGFRSENNITAVANPKGRFPANTILTYDKNDYDEVCGNFPSSVGSKAQNLYTNSSKYGGNSLLSSSTKRFSYQDGYNDEGSASRYFYCAKTSKKDRDEGLDDFEPIKCSMMASNANINKDGNFTGMLAGRETISRNTHPTVKPTELMQYLIRLVCPKNSIILDPFMGSGSTGKAVAFENVERNKNYRFIGIEQDEKYCEIANARIMYIANEYVATNVDSLNEFNKVQVKKSKQQKLF